ncbi:MerR family transcriptional regulator [Naasia lichenicola]|uniref:MerR family transcriptional regulator n=1 Tax=Naasia lichenicola TaxID=2565933 RepID=A0A4S4FQU3_9MICO|nr:MerR family transcriptional regulator [Naasia lichenicola]THG32983.1 MerR family transcriptional regulator [Naasia lichenicola]
MTITETSLSISQMADASGLSTHTLRYYEREGLMLGSIERASSTHRRYSDGDITWVSFLTKLRSTGMPIRDLKLYVELVRAGENTSGARLALLTRHRESVRQQLREVTASLEAIDIKIALYETTVAEREAQQTGQEQR